MHVCVHQSYKVYKISILFPWCLNSVLAHLDTANIFPLIFPLRLTIAKYAMTFTGMYLLQNQRLQQRINPCKTAPNHYSGIRVPSGVPKRWLVVLPTISLAFLSALYAKQSLRSACLFWKGPAMTKRAPGTFCFIAASGVPKQPSPIRVAGLLLFPVEGPQTPTAPAM